jgi:hypothetical protein
MAIELNYDQAHEFIAKNESNHFYWDGWTLVKFSPHQGAYMDKKGIYRNNKWGYTSRYTVTKNGTWRISDKYARFI